MTINPAFWKNRRVLVTGHTGFKGSWLLMLLQELGADRCGIALKPTTSPNMFTLLNLSRDMQSHFADVRDLNKIHAIIHDFRPEIILHMAAQPLVLYAYRNPVETYSTNVMGTVHVLEAAKTCDSVKAIVNITTDKCYENREWIWSYRENEALGGYDPYSNSKACSELVTSAYLQSYYRNLNIGLATARAGNVIGGGDWSENRLIADVMNSVIEKKPVIIRNPTAIRPWQHVLEPLLGYLLLAEKLFESPDKYSEGWNFGPYSNDALTVENVIEKIFARWPQENKGWSIEADAQGYHEAHILKLDITKALTYLNWKPTLKIDDTIDLIISWYQAWIQNENMYEHSILQIKKYLKLSQE